MGNGVAPYTAEKHPLFMDWQASGRPGLTGGDERAVRFLFVAAQRLIEDKRSDPNAALFSIEIERAMWERIRESAPQQVQGDDLQPTVVGYICYHWRDCVRHMGDHVASCGDSFTQPVVNQLFKELRRFFGWLSDLGIPGIDTSAIVAPTVRIAAAPIVKKKSKPPTAVAPAKRRHRAPTRKVSAAASPPPKTSTLRRTLGERKTADVLARPPSASSAMHGSLGQIRTIRRGTPVVTNLREFITARNAVVDVLVKLCGLHFTEAYALRCEDVDLVRNNLRVSACAGYAREVPISADAFAVVRDYWSQRREVTQGRGWFLIGADGGMLVVDDNRASSISRYLPPAALQARDELITWMLRHTERKFGELVCMKHRQFLRSISPNEMKKRSSVLDSLVQSYIAVVQSRRDHTLWSSDLHLAPFFLAEDGDFLTGDPYVYSGRKSDLTFAFPAPTAPKRTGLS